MRGALRFAAGALLALCAVAPAEAATEAGLTGYDVLTRPGRTVKLRAKLERKGMMGINPDVSGESIDFFLTERDGVALEEAEFLKSDETDGDGMAEVDWVAPEAGRWVIEGRVRRGSDYVALPARVLVAAPPPDRTILLVQLDETVTKATNLQMFRGTPNDKIAVVEGAREILEVLAGPYQLVYLTDLEVGFTGKFKDWLTLRKIPEAPVIFWELFERSLSHATYMDKLIGKLRQDFPQATIGVGGRPSDGAAFVQHGAAGIVLARDAELDEAVIRAVGWHHVLLHVTQLHHTAELLGQLARGEPEAQQAALAELSRLGPEGVGYVHRFRSSSDLELATAATQVAAKLKALDAFTDALDLSSANAALTSLLAAWRHGEPAAAAHVYQDHTAGLAAEVPTFSRIEQVARNEPEPDKVVFKLRLIGEDGASEERELVFLREGERKVWKLVAPASAEETPPGGG